MSFHYLQPFDNLLFISVHVVEVLMKHSSPIIIIITDEKNLADFTSTMVKMIYVPKM